MTKVNVIITCYNKEETITRAIESVKQQTFQDFFCIVVDDGSTDNSWNVINKSIEDDKRFIAIKLKNCGVANARNTGIYFGNAPYITCLDGDDGLENNFLETCYNAISKDSSLGIVYTDVLLAHIDGYFTVARWPDAEPEKQFDGYNQIPCCNMFRRDVFERLGGYKQRYAPKGAGAEDAELWLRFFKLGYRAKKITNEPLFIYNTFGGLTQNSQYEEVNWTNWHTTKTFASLDIPENNIAHPVYERDNPEISIIIPVGPGHEHYLVDALDSLEAQTFQNWEAVVVWDGFDAQKNKDGVYILENKYIEHYQTSYLYPTYAWTGKNKAMGAGFARNLGAKHSRGKYLVFLDADDYLQPRFLELTLSAMKYFDADWIYTDLYSQTIYNEDQYQLKCNEFNNQDLMNKVIRKKSDWVEFIYRYTCPEFSVQKLFNGGVAAVTGLYRKKDFDLVGGFDEDNNREDWDFHFKLAKDGKCGLRLPLPLFTYRLHTGTRREYKYDNEIDFETGKEQDKQRLYKTYNYEELKMACTNCKKDKIQIQPAQERDLSTLIYTGKIAGGTVKGPVTGKSYAMNVDRNIHYIERVYPQDAQIFVQQGLFKPVPREKTDNNIIISPTPQKVEVVEMSRGERLKRQQELLAQRAQKARKIVEKMFTKEEKQTVSNWWYNSEDTYKTIAVLKQTIEQQENLTQEQLEKALEYERAHKNRKGATSYLEELLDTFR